MRHIFKSFSIVVFVMVFAISMALCCCATQMANAHMQQGRVACPHCHNDGPAHSEDATSCQHCNLKANLAEKTPLSGLVSHCFKTAFHFSKLLASVYTDPSFFFRTAYRGALLPLARSAPLYLQTHSLRL